jgi:hypothetical protein
MKSIQSEESFRSKIVSKLLLITVEPSLFFYFLAIYLQFGGFQNMIFGKVCERHFNATFCSQYNSTEHKDAFDLVQRDSSR